MSQAQIAALPYAHALPDDAHRQAWRTVARIVGVGCLCHGVLICANMIMSIIPHVMRSISSMNDPMWQYLLFGVYCIAGATLAVSGGGLIFRLAVVRRPLVWSAGALILLSATVHGIAVVQVYSVMGMSSLTAIVMMMRIALLPILHTAIICGMAVALLTRRPLIEALKRG